MKKYSLNINIDETTGFIDVKGKVPPKVMREIRGVVRKRVRAGDFGLGYPKFGYGRVKRFKTKVPRW